MSVPQSNAGPTAFWHTPADSDQGSIAWHQARLGCVTASRIADVVTRTKTGYGAARQTYMRQLLAERLTGMPTETYPTAAMRWGIDMEPHAVAAYEDALDIDTQVVGFLQHPALAFAGASPDRLVGTYGLVEIKCPTTPVHIDTLLGGVPPERYIFQMQWQMACSGRQWCDFVSFDPRLPPAYACFITRVSRDDELILRLECEASTFLEELEGKLDALELCSESLGARVQGAASSRA